MIPRMFHRIWFGTRKRPELYDDYWREWGKLHPGWQMKTWTEDNLPELRNSVLFTRAKRRAKSAGTAMTRERATAVMRADIVAYELVRNYGGVYLNCDMMPLKSIEPLMSSRAFVGMEDEYHICNAVMGAEREHPLFQTVVDRLGAHCNRTWDSGMELATGPQFFTSIWRSGDYDLNVLPQSAFYPVHHSEVPIGTTDYEPLAERARGLGSYACHMWGHRSQEGERTE